MPNSVIVLRRPRVSYVYDFDPPAHETEVSLPLPAMSPPSEGDVSDFFPRWGKSGGAGKGARSPHYEVWGLPPLSLRDISPNGGEPTCLVNFFPGEARKSLQEVAQGGEVDAHHPAKEPGS